MKQASNKSISSHRRQLYILLPTLVIAMVIAFFFVKHLLDGRVQERAFMSTKQSVLALQGKFNMMDSGWKYSEACRDDGQVYSGGQVSSCSLGLENPNILTANLTQDHAKGYLQALSTAGWQVSSDLSVENGEYFTRTSVSDLIGCVFNLNSHRASATLTCYGKADKAYFPYQAR